MNLYENNGDILDEFGHIIYQTIITNETHKNNKKNKKNNIYINMTNTRYFYYLK